MHNRRQTHVFDANLTHNRRQTPYSTPNSCIIDAILMCSTPTSRIIDARLMHIRHQTHVFDTKLTHNRRQTHVFDAKLMHTQHPLCKAEDTRSWDCQAARIRCPDMLKSYRVLLQNCKQAFNHASASGSGATWPPGDCL